MTKVYLRLKCPQKEGRGGGVTKDSKQGKYTKKGEEDRNRKEGIGREEKRRKER